jgi:hypothetical protein
MNRDQRTRLTWVWAKGHRRRHSLLATVAGASAALCLAAAGAPAQPPPAASGPSAPPPNCAVTTIRLAGLDATQFFGLSGGPTGFSQSFGVQPGADRPAAQRCIRLELANPSPGDLLPIGGYVIDGFAFDPNTPNGQGSGISGIQVFLDDPDQGGVAIGQATASTSTTTSSPANQFGLANGRAAAFGEQFANSGFHLTVQIPVSANGAGHALFVSTQSATGNRLGAVAVPVAVGALTPLPRLPLTP